MREGKEGDRKGGRLVHVVKSKMVPFKKGMARSLSFSFMKAILCFSM